MFQPPDEDPTGRRPQPFTRPPAQPGVMTSPNGRPGGLMARLRRRGKPPMGPAGPMAPPTYDFAAPIKQPFPMPDDGRQLPAMDGPALPAMPKMGAPMMDPPEPGPMAPPVGMYRGADGAGMGGMDVTDDRLKGLLSGLY